MNPETKVSCGECGIKVFVKDAIYIRHLGKHFCGAVCLDEHVQRQQKQTQQQLQLYLA